MKPYYINPAISIYDSFKETFEKDDFIRNYWNHDKSQTFDLEGINRFSCLFIIGEPGYGKSQLINQLIDQINSETATIRIDCREFADKKKAYDTGSFTHIYFDGLDEVPPILFLESLNRIREINQQNPDKKIFIACRTHYITRFERYVELFKKAKFLQLQPFREFHIRNYLNHFLSDDELIETIVYKSIGQPGRDSVLKTPRYLAALVQSISEQQILPEEIKAMGRTDIFEKVIYYQLMSEVKRQSELLSGAGDAAAPAGDQLQVILTYLKDQELRKLNMNEIELTKRVLEKLAFIMEVYQRNRISKDELITFLDEAQSNVNQIFLTNSSIDRFIERTLKSVENTFLEFEHTEFQEYLAAKELVRLSDSPQVLYDLILQKDLQVIYSSWLDVLQYAIELDAEKVAGSLANYLKNNAERQTDDRLIEILMGPGIEKADDQVKARLFEAIYWNFQSSGKILYQKNDLLAGLYVPAKNEHLLAIQPLAVYDSDTLRQFINQVLMVRSIANNNKLQTGLKQVWKAYLLQCLSIPELKGQYEVMLWALEALDAATELKAMAETMKQEGEEQLSIYLQTIGRLCGDEMTDFFIEILQTKPFLKGKEDFLTSLKTEAGITAVFNALMGDPTLIKSLFNNESRFITFYQLFDHIAAINSAGLDALSEQLLYTMAGNERYSYYSGHIKDYIDRALEYLIRKDESFLERLLQRPNAEDIVDHSSEAVAHVITADQFDQIYEGLLEERWVNRAIYRVIGQLNIAGDMGRQALVSELKQKYPQLFTQPEETPETAAAREQRERDRLAQQLQDHLIPGEDYYHRDLFQFYLSNREKLKDIIKPEELEYIKEQLTNILDRVEPEIYRVNLDRHGNTVTYHANYDYWFRFGHFIEAALQLDLVDVLTRNRSKIIKYLPLLNEYMINEQDRTPRILDFLGDISDAEAQELLEFCTQRNDDYIFSSAASFAKLISSYKLHAFKPVLKIMIESDITDHNDKEKALIAYGELSTQPTDQAYLMSLFNEYDENIPSKKRMAELANEILIRQFGDEPSIDWRFAQLISRQRAYPDRPKESSARPYPDWEQELDRPQFAAVFDEMEDKNIHAHMEKLLRKSLKLRKKPDFNRYSHYLQLIVFNYYNKHNSLAVLNRIRGILSEFAFKSTAGTFKHFLRSLEINLTNSYELFRTISEPVKKYNEIKNKQYLQVRDQADLAALVDAAIEDLQDFVLNKGYYQPAVQLSGAKKAKLTSLFNEDILQKTFQVTLENSLLRQGLRDTDIHREVELFDGKRLDILLKYGFVGPIMAEMKLLHNTEITKDVQRQAYKEKMKQYIAATKSEYSYYLVFKVNDDPGGKHKTAFDDLVTEYADIPNLTIKLIDCPIK